MSLSIFPWEFPVRFGSLNDNPVTQVKRLLNQATNSDFAYGKPPIIERVDERSGQSRMNTSQDAFYIYSPTDATVDRISADGVAANSNEEVRVLIWCLQGPERANQYRQDIVQYLAQFIDDNTEETNLNNIEPIAQSDLRNEAQPRQSSHSITGVTVSTDNYLQFD